MPRINLKLTDEELRDLRIQAKAAGFRALVSRYIRHLLGLKPLPMGRPYPAKEEPKP